MIITRALFTQILLLLRESFPIQDYNSICCLFSCYSLICCRFIYYIYIILYITTSHSLGRAVTSARYKTLETQENLKDTEVTFMRFAFRFSCKA